MYKIAFFCIPAHGHTNPTLGVVKELTARGNEVWYYSFQPFQKEIEAAGARLIPCDAYDIQMKLCEKDQGRVGKDIGFSVHLLVNTTLALDEMVCKTLTEWKPDCVIADSMAVWGKFAAIKLGIPFLSSTTIFAFNRYSAKIMKQSRGQMLAMLLALPGINRNLKRLREQGYPVKNVLSLIQNDNETNTIVYTSKEFQPCSETFSDRYAFVGPSIREPGLGRLSKTVDKEIEAMAGKKQIYISMGTVNNQLPDFYRCCIEALRDSNYRVVMSVGEHTDTDQFGVLPPNIFLAGEVDQIAVLQKSDVFMTHCGMNSVNESLFYGVPLILYPQTSEQQGVANQVAELSAGVFLETEPYKKQTMSHMKKVGMSRKDHPESIKEAQSEKMIEAIKQAVDTILNNHKYRENAAEIAETFRRAGGAKAAAAVILSLAGQNKEGKEATS